MNVKSKEFLLPLALMIVSCLSGCKNMDINKLTQSSVSAFNSVNLSDTEVRALAAQSCQELDNKNAIAPSSSQYVKRLNEISKTLGYSIEGVPVSYKVYLTKDVNAWAMANGCIRVYSGLMDLMNDNEVTAVLGHELGHVALGHSRKSIQIAYAALAARESLSAGNGAIGALSESQLGDIALAVVKATYSRSQETEADEYSFKLLRKKSVDPIGLVTSFDKLNSLSDTHQKSLFDSHPPSQERAEHIKKLISKN